MGHFEACTAEAALDVEAFVGVAAVKNALVTSDLGSNIVERLDDA
jgi:hypothetical protein